MADFLTDLWQSVLTPGTTPTLLIATNCTFGALQLLLLGLLVATHSIHFAVLSVLCAGLWRSINWFAAELHAAQTAAAEDERLRKQRRHEKARPAAGDAADDEGDETEVEGDARDHATGPGGSAGVAGRGGCAAADGVDALPAAPHAPAGAAGAGAASGVHAASRTSESRQRRGPHADPAPSELSTDSEWEKVDEGR